MTWTASPVERVRPGEPLGERDALEAWIDYHRATLLLKCSGLTADQLKARPAPPSTLSLLGLVRHMTEVERWWFRINAADLKMPFQYSTDEHESADFDDIEDADAEANLELFRCEIDEARKAVRDKDLDEVITVHQVRPERRRDIRWIYLHMLEEYARHNGHADLIRELIDGATGE